MKEITVTDGQQKLSMTQIVLGSSDYLKLDNMPKVNHMFDLYVELGGNTFDTARHYRDAESVIGDWMSRHDRKAFNIITKCCHPKRGALDVPRVSPENMRADLTESLQHLQTEYVDVLLLHRADPTKPVGPLMEAFSALVDEGKVRFFGVSNWTLSRVQEAISYCREHGLHPLSFNSPNFSLASVNQPRWDNSVTADDEMIDWHTKTQFPLLSWSAQAEAFFAHRFKPEDADNPELKEYTEVYFNDLNWRRMKVCDAIAAKHGVKPIQVSLAYVLNAPFPVLATIGPEEEWMLEESFETAELQLTTQEVQELRKGALD